MEIIQNVQLKLERRNKNGKKETEDKGNKLQKHIINMVDINPTMSIITLNIID